MSRVDKGGRSFRPLAKPKPPALAIVNPLPTQSNLIPAGLARRSTTPSATKPGQSSSGQPATTHPSLHTSPGLPPHPPDSPPLFIPEASPPLFLPEHDPHVSPCSTQPCRTPSIGAGDHVQPTTKLSAAAKMRLKAQEAKAARAAEKLKNTSSAGGTPSLDGQHQEHPLVDSHQGKNAQVCSQITNTQTSRVEDIPVPIASNRDTPITRATDRAWSPPIDPLLAIAAFVDDTTLATTHASIGQDILVSTSNPPPPSLLDSNPILSNITNRTSIPNRIQTVPPPKTKPKKPVKKTVTRPSHSNASDEEEISPRLKRKRHLEALRKKKKKVPEDGLAQTQEDKDMDDLDAMNARCSARTKRRIANSKAKQTQNRKKLKADRVNGEAKADADDGAPEGSESDSDSPIDPNQVAMAELTEPSHRKGQSSETLSTRLQLIIERRDREKMDRLAAREQRKKTDRQVLRDRSQSVKLRRRQQDQVDFEERDDDEPDVENQNNDDSNHQDRATQLDETRDGDQAPNEEKNRKKTLKEYGIDDLDSDSDMEELEEVIFDEFAHHPKTNAGKKIKDVAPSIPPENNGEEEEEIVEENYEVDCAPQPSQYAPQLRVVDGQIVLDQDSLEVDRRDQSAGLEEMEVVEESDSTRLINSQTWSKAVRGERWSADETTLFYDAVRLFGSDFEMISQLFPGRTRRQIRAKWNREEKSSPQEITDALMGKKKANADVEKELTPIAENEREGEEGSETETLVIPSHLDSFDQYAKIVGIDCTGPIPLDPMDKWRENERLEWVAKSSAELGSNNYKSKKKHGSDSSSVDIAGSDDEDHDADLVVEENFTGWGEVEQ